MSGLFRQDQDQDHFQYPQVLRPRPLSRDYRSLNFPLLLPFYGKVIFFLADMKFAFVFTLLGIWMDGCCRTVSVEPMNIINRRVASWCMLSVSFRFVGCRAGGDRMTMWTLIGRLSTVRFDHKQSFVGMSAWSELLLVLAHTIKWISDLVGCVVMISCETASAYACKTVTYFNQRRPKLLFSDCCRLLESAQQLIRLLPQIATSFNFFWKFCYNSFAVQPVQQTMRV